MAILRQTVSWRRPTRRQRESTLTATERANVRAAVRFLKKRHGTALLLAKALGVSKWTVEMAAGRARLSADLAVRVARLADAPLSLVLDGGWPRRGECIYCGHITRTRAKVRHA